MATIEGMENTDSLIDGPEWEAIVAAVCREGETDAAIDELVELLAA